MDVWRPFHLKTRYLLIGTTAYLLKNIKLIVKLAIDKYILYPLFWWPRLLRFVRARVLSLSLSLSLSKLIDNNKLLYCTKF
jgi:hypothetical protein